MFKFFTGALCSQLKTFKPILLFVSKKYVICLKSTTVKKFRIASTNSGVKIL